MRLLCRILNSDAYSGLRFDEVSRGRLRAWLDLQFVYVACRSEHLARRLDAIGLLVFLGLNLRAESMFRLDRNLHRSISPRCRVLGKRSRVALDLARALRSILVPSDPVHLVSLFIPNPQSREEPEHAI